ncbi:MAG: hypothetical protein R2828_02080 [Saprospiraceae bacterium]
MSFELRCRILITFVLVISLGQQQALFGQNYDKFKNKIEKYRGEEWPPQRIYSRISLGYALQNIFKKHSEYCGFSVGEGKRDFIPYDISKFLGRRDLRTKVEMADIRGGGLMYYIFNREEITQPFETISYVPSRILKIGSISNQFLVNPDENFDSFILTKNCSGYLKAALDAGIEPPYVAFKTALNSDDRRESSVLALSGAFQSPLGVVLSANNDRTTEVMMNLWRFYKENPQFVNQAYYLREFEGVMIKHSSSAEDNFRMESEVGVNINGPLSARLKTNFAVGRTKSTAFSGTDWETIIFADFGGDYYREKLFSPLPTPADIETYFQNIKPIYQETRDYPLMTEGAEHKHYLIVEGIPEDMTTNFWELETVNPGVYDGKPTLLAEPFQDSKTGAFGCRFTLLGKPVSENFRGPLASRPGKLSVSYRIKSRYPVGGAYIRLHVNEEIQTSAHPIADISGGEFDLSKKEDRRFAFQWRFIVDLNDKDNPVDFSQIPYISNLMVRRSDKKIDVNLVDIRADQQRHRYYVTIESLDTYPLDKIDDRNMINYNMSLDMHLQGNRSVIRSVRPLKGVLSFPSIKPDPQPEPVLPTIIPTEVPIPVPSALPAPPETVPVKSEKGNEEKKTGESGN